MTTAYTALESLLLFQGLRAEGVGSLSVFNRISDQLKSIPVVTNDASFDGRRLSPDALRELYLWLLKEEIKSDLQKQAEKEHLQNGDVESASSKKRKVPSPRLMTVHEASQHAHLIPRLVSRLYVRYREHTVEKLREDERHFDSLSRDTLDTESTERTRQPQSQPATSSAHSLRPPVEDHVQLKLNGRPTVEFPLASPPVAREANDPTFPKHVSDLGSLLNHGPEATDGTVAQNQIPSITPLPSFHEMAPRSRQIGIPANIPSQVNQVQHRGSYSQSPGAPQAPFGATGPMASPRSQYALPRPSSSPKPFLPPPPGLPLHVPGPRQSYGSPGLLEAPQLSQQPIRAPRTSPPQTMPVAASPVNDHPRPNPPLQHPGFYQQVPAQSVNRRASYGALQQNLYPTQPNHAGGYQLPPFSVDPQEPVQTPQIQPAQIPAHQPPLNTPAQTSAYDGLPHRLHRPQSTASTVPWPTRGNTSHLVSDIVAALATPPRVQAKTRVWKSERRPPHLKTGTPVPSPQPEPLSPVIKRSEIADALGRTAFDGQGPAGQSLTTQRPALHEQPKSECSPPGVVPTADGPAQVNRSHSASATTESLPTADGELEAGSNVNAEQSTPAPDAEEPAATAEQQSGGGRMTRHQRGTLSAQARPPSKRKRQQSFTAPATNPGPDAANTTSPRPTTVLATRNFHRASQTLMNDINSHKHASYFANAVRDKDAPGYTDIIKRPQHFKSIRTAIMAGSRAVNAAAAVPESPATPAGGRQQPASDTAIELDRTVDLLPPKGIVNGAQLEKEVMRMLANAVMFNPGEDGLVRDTREMFEDIEAKVREWRGAEKLKEGEGEGPASARMDADEGKGKGKRRKL